jgi:hypothetical protein
LSLLKIAGHSDEMFCANNNNAHKCFGLLGGWVLLGCTGFYTQYRNLHPATKRDRTHDGDELSEEERLQLKVRQRHRKSQRYSRAFDDDYDVPVEERGQGGHGAHGRRTQTRTVHMSKRDLLKAQLSGKMKHVQVLSVRRHVNARAASSASASASARSSQAPTQHRDIESTLSSRETAI